jgi:hypothetical protein
MKAGLGNRAAPLRPCPFRPEEIEVKYEQEVYERDGFKCVYCGYDGKASPEAWHRGRFNIDHWIPRSKGGTDEMENLRTACGACNSGKGDNEFPSLEAAQLWLRIYREECADPFWETYVAKTGSTWKSGGIKRTWDRYNALMRDRS